MHVQRTDKRRWEAQDTCIHIHGQIRHIMFLTLHVCVSSCRYIGGSSHNLLRGVVVHELLVLKGDEATAADVGALTEYLGKKWDVVLPPRGLR